MTTEEMNEWMRQVNRANARGDRDAAIWANEQLAGSETGTVEDSC